MAAQFQQDSAQPCALGGDPPFLSLAHAERRAGPGWWVGAGWGVVLACKRFPGCLVLSLGDYKSQNAMHRASFLLDHAWGKWCTVTELCVLGHVVPALVGLLTHCEMGRSCPLICPWQGWQECG